MNVQLAVFDMAGTTILDKGNVNTALQEAFLTVAVQLESTQIDRVRGYKKIAAIKILLDKYAPELNEDANIVNELHELFNKNMIMFYENDPDLRPLSNAIPVFQELKERGIKVALNTGFTRPVAYTMLNRLGWYDSPWIDAIICSDEVSSGRPHPYMIQNLMNRLAVRNAAAVLKVGDTEVDIKEGRNAGCGLVVAVTTGACTRKKLLQFQPDHIIDSLEELLPLIDQSNS